MLHTYSEVFVPSSPRCVSRFHKFSSLSPKSTSKTQHCLNSMKKNPALLSFHHRWALPDKISVAAGASLAPPARRGEHTTNVGGDRRFGGSVRGPAQPGGAWTPRPWGGRTLPAGLGGLGVSGRHRPRTPTSSGATAAQRSAAPHPFYSAGVPRLPRVGGPALWSRPPPRLTEPNSSRRQRRSARRPRPPRGARAGPIPGCGETGTPGGAGVWMPLAGFF